MMTHNPPSSRTRGPITTAASAGIEEPVAMGARLRGHGRLSRCTIITALTLLMALSACGTKGDLECPKGTVPQIDGTCRPPPAPAK
jgi:hypothetical protein